MRELRTCGDCGAFPGEQHKPGCDVERCRMCGGQAMSCDCIYVVNDMDPVKLEEEHSVIYENGPTDEMERRFDEELAKIGGRSLWTGDWPGNDECREFGYWCKWVDGSGWVRCEPADPAATEDLNRLYEEACAGVLEWSREQGRFVKKQPAPSSPS